MTIENSHINAIPTSIIPARVNIHHLQLRDLLQHSGVKDRVLFVSRLQVEQADFSLPHKSPSTYCTLDFQPNCLTTGCGLLATGGQHGELALRLLNHEAAEAQPTPWLLRTPTGGSINNAITIQSDLNHPLSSSSASTSNAYSRSNPDNKNQSAVVDTSGIPTSYSPWARDEPTSSSNLVRPGFLFGDEEMESELSQSVFEELAAAYGFDPSSVNRSSRWRRTPQTNTSITSSTTANTANSSATAVAVPPIQVMVTVGDTPQVFIHSISPSGEHMKIATYTASSDACFSTTWSPDASKFAVASQDGVVSVWDVRSSKRLAGVSTSQGGGGGSGAARVVKWSPCGRYLAFTEHRNFWGVTDAVTFTQTQRIAAPSHLTSNSGGGNAGATLSSGVDVREGWIERRMAAEDRFRMVTGGEEAIARDRERRSMIHATFMREWNRAVNLVDSSSSSSSSSPSLTATNSSASTNNDSTNTNTMGFSRNSRGSNYYPPEFLVNPLATTATNSAGATSGVGGSGGVLERVAAKYDVRDVRLSVVNADLL
uniref:Wd40 repeat-like protein n=1 Tax=Melanopsichium pennsylvanicum 4 TaxID=1398559 RepID=A0A077R9U9_9BASI|nr:wd40 repeat-like protein [Melanopsichium pennsylvanicum 4]